MNKPKSNRILLCTGFSLVILVLNVCNVIDTEIKRSQISLLETQNLCVIPLVPHLRNNVSNRASQKFQHIVVKNAEDFRYLENIGWAYVNRTKTGFDSELYKIKDQMVKCMNLYQPNRIVNKNRTHF